MQEIEIMMYKLLILICCFLVSVNGIGQRKKNAANQLKLMSGPDGKACLPEEVATLFKTYHFAEATEKLQAYIEKANKDELGTDTLDYYAEKCRIGENMLQATEKVTFIDSFVVNKNEFLQSFHIGTSCGSINFYENIFPTDQKASDDLKRTTIYLNEFQDNLIYSYPDKNGYNRLVTRNKVGDNWSKSSTLEELSDQNGNQGYPYLLSDGTTLYYASEGENSLGGYDIYLTRYNTETKKYLKPENIGMPFNSPANDYLYAIDEENNLGWFVSDRYQPEGKVCIYVFIPPSSRDIYTINEDNVEQVIDAARLKSIKQTQKNTSQLSDARTKLQQMMLTSKDIDAPNNQIGIKFYVANGITYSDINQFKSNKAKEIASQLIQLEDQRSQLIISLRKNRLEYGRGNTSVQTEILKQEKSLEQLDVAIQTLENNIRKEEQTQLKIN